MSDDLIARLRDAADELVKAMNEERWRDATFLLIAKVDALYKQVEAGASRPQEACPNRAEGQHTWTNKTPSPPLGTCCDCGQWAMGYPLPSPPASAPAAPAPEPEQP